MQRPPVLAGGDGLLGLLRRLPGLLVADGDVGVQPPVNPGDALQVGVGGLNRRDLSGLDKPAQFRHAEEGYLAALDACHQDYSVVRVCPWKCLNYA